MHQTCTGTFLGACRCLVHLVVSFLFFLVPVNVLWSQSHQTCTNKTKQTKPLDAPDLHRHQKKQKKLKFPGTMGPLLSSCWIVFCVFFWCLSMFGASSGLFFVFFWCLSMFLYISCQDHGEKSAFYWGFRPSKCNTSVFTVLSSFLMEIHYPMGCRPLILYRYLTNIQYVFIYIYVNIQ